MIIDIWQLALILGIPTAITSFSIWALQRSINKREKQREERDNAIWKREILTIKSISASISLGEATAEAVRTGKCNGEMTKALEYTKVVKHELKDFLFEQGIKNT